MLRVHKNSQITTLSIKLGIFNSPELLPILNLVARVLPNVKALRLQVNCAGFSVQEANAFCRALGQGRGSLQDLEISAHGCKSRMSHFPTAVSQVIKINSYNLKSLRLNLKVCPQLPMPGLRRIYQALESGPRLLKNLTIDIDSFFIDNFEAVSLSKVLKAKWHCLESLEMPLNSEGNLTEDDLNVISLALHDGDYDKLKKLKIDLLDPNSTTKESLEGLSKSIASPKFKNLKALDLGCIRHDNFSKPNMEDLWKIINCPYYKLNELKLVFYDRDIINDIQLKQLASSLPPALNVFHFRLSLMDSVSDTGVKAVCETIRTKLNCLKVLHFEVEGCSKISARSSEALVAALGAKAVSLTHLKINFNFMEKVNAGLESLGKVLSKNHKELKYLSIELGYTKKIIKKELDSFMELVTSNLVGLGSLELNLFALDLKEHVKYTEALINLIITRLKNLKYLTILLTLEDSDEKLIKKVVTSVRDKYSELAFMLERRTKADF